MALKHFPQLDWCISVIEDLIKSIKVFEQKSHKYEFRPIIITMDKWNVFL